MSVASAPLRRPGTLAVWWQAVRPFSLVVAAVPGVVGTAALFAAHRSRPLVALGCIVLAALLLAGTNSLNDAEDAATGADDTDTAMPSLSLRQGWIDPAGARRVAVACFAAAALLGVALVVSLHKPGLLALGAAALLVGWAYTAPPLRLAYRPLGELASGLPIGLGVTWGTAAAQTDTIPASVWWSGATLALLTAAVLHANNARDRGHDRAVGKRTLATYLPRGVIVLEYRLLTAGIIPVVVLGVATHGLPWPCLIALLPGAMALRAALAVSVTTDGRGWTMALIAAVKLVTLTGVCLTLGLVVSRFI
ncbi:MAG: prenyltransferase [Candidatus Dormibacteria bacterium]